MVVLLRYVGDKRSSGHLHAVPLAIQILKIPLLLITNTAGPPEVRVLSYRLFGQIFSWGTVLLAVLFLPFSEQYVCFTGNYVCLRRKEV